MTPDEFRRAMEAKPFRPIVIPLQGGGSVVILDPSQVGTTPSGNYFEEGEARVLEMRKDGDRAAAEAPVFVMVKDGKGIVSMINLTDGTRHRFDLTGLR